MPSSPLGSTNGRTTSGVASYHRLWISSHNQTVSCFTCHHRLFAENRLNDFGRGMPSLPLDNMHDQMMSGVACHHGPWTAHMVERRRAWQATVAIGQYKKSNDVGGSICHHRPCTAHTAERRRAWHDITAFGLHARSNDVRHGMTSPH